MKAWRTVLKRPNELEVRQEEEGRYAMDGRGGYIDTMLLTQGDDIFDPTKHSGGSGREVRF